MSKSHVGINQRIVLPVVIMLCHATLNAQETIDTLEVQELIGLSFDELRGIEIVSASKNLQKIGEAPAKVLVITAEKIKQKGYFTLDEALSDLPGFQFRDIIGFNSYIFQRGVPSQNNKILILVDGIQINELNSGGFYGGAHFNLSNVRQIEVVYGPASALYGTNAMSGIVNIITNNPKDLNGVQASILAGNYNTRSVDFSIGQHLEKSDFGYSFSGMFKQSDKADLRGAKGDYNWTDNMENFEDDLAFDGKMIYKNLSAGFVYQQKSASRTTNYKTTGTNYLDAGSDMRMQFLNAYMKYKYAKNKNWSFQSQLYYRNALIMKESIAYITSDTGSTGGQVRYYRPNDLIGLDNQLNILPFDKLSITGGVVLELERLSEGTSRTYSGDPDNPAATPPKPSMMTNQLASLYVHSQYAFVKHLAFVLGLRYDISSYYGSVLTPRISLLYNRQKVMAKLLYSEAFRAPRPWDYWYGTGSTDLDPEKMRTVELYLAYYPIKNLLVDVSIYKSRINGVLTKEADRWLNSGELNTDGFETSIMYEGGKLKPYLNYTYNFSSSETGEIVPEIGFHNANTGLLFAFTKQFMLDVGGKFMGRRKNVQTVTTTGNDYIESALVINSTLSLLDIKSFDFQLIVRNLLDTEYYHTSNRPPERYRQPQRTFMLKISYKFRFDSPDK